MTLPDRPPILDDDDDETYVVIVNRIDDTRLGLDALIRYRLLIEDRYPDVFVPAAEAPQKKATPRRARRTTPGSKAKPRRRDR